MILFYTSLPVVVVVHVMEDVYVALILVRGGVPQRDVGLMIATVDQHAVL